MKRTVEEQCEDALVAIGTGFRTLLASIRAEQAEQRQLFETLAARKRRVLEVEHRLLESEYGLWNGGKSVARPHVPASEPDPMAQVCSNLCSRGFHIFKGLAAKMVTGVDVAALFQQIAVRAHDIFNGGGGCPERGGDHKRQQTSVSELDGRSSAYGLAQKLNALLSGLCYGKRCPDESVYIISHAGCADQPAHIDWEPHLLKDDIVDDGICRGYPMGVIIALQDETYLNVWPGSVGYDKTHPLYPHQRLELQLGDVLLFRADLVHSGASYAKPNIRFHAYLDREGVEREDNTTHYMNEVANIAPIGQQHQHL